MGVFSAIGAMFAGSSGTFFMFIVLAVSDHLWGENVFNCPCGPHRYFYTSAFLVVPPVIIIFLDTSWRVLFGNCQVCCDEWDGRLKRCCCCSRKMFETLLRLLLRPSLIAVLWLAFSCMEPKFGRCMLQERNCTCTQKEIENSGCTPELKTRSETIRMGVAYSSLAVTGLAIVIALSYGLCKLCHRCYRRRALCFACCWRDRIPYTQIEDEENSEKIRVLSRCLYAFGVVPKTVLRLQEEDLMCERRLMIMDMSSLKSMGGCIGLGQLEILLEHRKNLRLARWMLDKGYTSDSIRTIVEKENLVGSTVLEELRESLRTTDMVEEKLHEAFQETLRLKNMGSLLPPPDDILKADRPSEDFHMVKELGGRG